ncbi:MAG: 6-phosphofructokinase [Desulforegulaceae bacterium]|nr:6-phosphofructokinase [Desulforegulaceae bacterium]
MQDKNEESGFLKTRCNYNPPRCLVYENKDLYIEKDLSIDFDIHPEAAKLLPDLCKNRFLSFNKEKKGSKIDKSLKKRIGVVFSGGPAPGGHNVIAGLYDFAKEANPENTIIGFLGGPEGIVEGSYIEIDSEIVDKYRNKGGFSMLKTGRTKIDTEDKKEKCLKNCKELGLDTLVIIGGDDSNTNAAFLAQSFYNQSIQVLGVPKTIDGDIQIKDVNGKVLCPISFGFHSAASSFASNIRGLQTDAASDVKYWHICKVMGRVASHLALEVGLQTQPNMVLIGEELADYVDQSKIEKSKGKEMDYSAFGMTLRHLSRVVCDLIVKRAEMGKNYGVLVIPEGLLEFINEIQTFIIKLSSLISEYNKTHDNSFHTDFNSLDSKLDYLRRMARQAQEENLITVWTSRDDDLFNDIPDFFKEGLLTERDNHGNFQFSQVETDRVLMELVRDYLKILKDRGVYRLGVEKNWYLKKMKEAGLDPERYAKVIFENSFYDLFLLRKKDIISRKTLRQALVNANLILKDEEPPKTVSKIFEKTIPKFKMQTHFYGYDGRGSDPTAFDSNYTYNLGATTFFLALSGCTGYMACVRNLEKDFSSWEPGGIPIAPLMHLEERKGKLDLVIEKAVVDLDSRAFKKLKSMRDEWLGIYPGEDKTREPDLDLLSEDKSHIPPMILSLNS